MISFMWIDCQSTNFMTELLFPFVQSITSFLIGIMEAFFEYHTIKTLPSCDGWIHAAILK